MVSASPSFASHVTASARRPVAGAEPWVSMLGGEFIEISFVFTVPARNVTAPRG